MKKLNNKGFFLVETLIVTSIVALAMVALYTQMTSLLDNYDVRLTYNTVDGMYAATEINDYILGDTGKYASFTGHANIPSFGYLEIPCSSFTTPTYCTALYNSFGVSKAYITKFNTADIKSFAPSVVGFSDDLKIFISNMKNETSGTASDYRLILEFTDGTFSTMKLNSGKDTVGPTISGPASMIVLQTEIEGTDYHISDGLTATDAVNGDVTSSITCTGASPNFTCTAYDSSGNASAGFARNITATPVTESFSATGAAQTFTAKITGYYAVNLVGGQGGTGLAAESYGGYGARAQGEIYLTAGTVVNVYVGGSGDSTSADSTPAGWNGGGVGRYYGGGGGGATDIRIGGTALANRVMVAGGGGGSNGRRSTSYDGCGGTGGAPNGGNGTYATATYNGTGATQSTFGLKGTYSTTGTPADGALGVGGQGGYYSSSYGAGGGGGGYYGGGGAADRYGGGGGGSSWADPAVIINVVYTANYNGSTTTTELAGSASFTFVSR